MFQEQEGIWYPSGDAGFKGIPPDLADLDDSVFPVVEQFRVAVQAGSALGLWPKRMAKEFDVVYTFEPNPENCYCVARNAPELNIIKFQAALGNDRRRVKVGSKKPWNYGGHYINGTGDIPVMRVDDLSLEVCDLLMLDIEGVEMEALLGAKQTLTRCSPVVVFESKLRCMDKFGYTPEDIHKFLEPLGYRYYKHMHGNKDEIWLPKNSRFFAET
jgi:FkbM family methyltransferase